MSVGKSLVGSALPTTWSWPSDCWTANWKVENTIMMLLAAGIHYCIKMVNVEKNSEGFLHFHK